ncbi:GNAT family N-acetyltransferase [Flavobacterium sp. MAH-1]|uniref:GNAT family N-acetyltransferase n=1 Tax=Flavobacterium agri TaxID=2743471 RepID=A0A7Y9C6P1_9FLAO|nr:GNAT family N-acetyltransferase [Flavobacterium agri]NUY82291.1 GNAT family N-acetyltransferase [Flavobacterium agri]NYA72315.1 GNAT family N-acetyltransferase [Flavobacterium agri]
MLTYDFSDFPILETERLILRRLRDSDVKEVFELRSDPETMKYIPRPLAKNHEDALNHIAIINKAIDKNEGINWAVTMKGDDTLIGIMGFYRTKFEHYRSEIGYMIHPTHNGKGFVSEALRRLVAYGFSDMGLHSIEAVIDPDNIGSERVLQKNGFVKEAHFRESEFYEGKFLDAVYYSILNTSDSVK